MAPVPDTAPQLPHPIRPGPGGPMGVPMRGHGGMRPSPAPQNTPGTPGVAIEAPPVDTPYDEDKALEIKLKSDPEAAKRYRSPRKAFFLSLVVPGAGQAYCGSYIKAGLFAAADLGLVYGWYKVAIVGSRDKSREARGYAATHWRQQRYEQTWEILFNSDTSQDLASLRQTVAPQREAYCASLYGDANYSDNYNACVGAPTSSNHYSLHADQFAKGGLKSTDSGAWTTQQVLDFRATNIKSQELFDDLIGRYQEFNTGWEDNTTVVRMSDLQAYFKLATDNDPSTIPSNPWGTSAMQAHYLALRNRADELARMQKWFIGGMIVNHLAAAFDAAFQAGRMNRKLLELESSWLDGIDVRGGFQLAGNNPGTGATVSLSF